MRALVAMGSMLMQSTTNGNNDNQVFAHHMNLLIPQKKQLLIRD